MNTEFQKFIKLAGGKSAAGRLIGVSAPRISQVKDRGVSKAMAKRIVDEYAQINLYKLLYG